MPQRLWTGSRPEPPAGVRGGGRDRQRDRGGEPPVPHSASGERRAAPADHGGRRAALRAQRPGSRPDEPRGAAARRPAAAPAAHHRRRARLRRRSIPRPASARCASASTTRRSSGSFRACSACSRRRRRGCASWPSRCSFARSPRRSRAALDAAVTVADELPANIRRQPLYTEGFTCLYDPAPRAPAHAHREGVLRAAARHRLVQRRPSRHRRGRAPQDAQRPVLGVELRARRRAHRGHRDAGDGSPHRGRPDPRGAAAPEEEAAAVHHPGLARWICSGPWPPTTTSPAGSCGRRSSRSPARRRRTKGS